MATALLAGELTEMVFPYIKAYIHVFAVHSYMYIHVHVHRELWFIGFIHVHEQYTYTYCLMLFLKVFDSATAHYSDL